MRHQVQRRRRGSASLEAQLDHPVAHQLADARPPIDMGDDLEQHARRCEFRHRLGFGKRAVLEAHGAACDVDGAEIQRAAQRVALDAEGGACELLRETPQLPPARVGGVGVDIDGMDIAACLAVRQRRGDDLSRHRVFAEACAVGHPDELEAHLRQPQR